MKENLKYIIVGLSIIISGSIIASVIQNLSHSVQNSYLSQSDISQFPVSVKQGWEMNSYEQNLDAEQIITYTLDSQKSVLKVWKNGILSEYSGKDLKAVYHHMGQVLLITYLNENDEKQFHFFNQPDKWE